VHSKERNLEHYEFGVKEIGINLHTGSPHFGKTKGMTKIKAYLVR